MAYHGLKVGGLIKRPISSDSYTDSFDFSDNERGRQDREKEALKQEKRMKRIYEMQDPQRMAVAVIKNIFRDF